MSIVDKNQISTSSDRSPSIQTVSWPQFRFFQVDEDWRRQWCSKLGLPYCTYKRSIGSSNTILTRPDRQSVRVMLGDGNCLFRSLSCVLTGSQQHHLLVRCLICNHMSSITHLLLPHIHPVILWRSILLILKWIITIDGEQILKSLHLLTCVKPKCMCIVFNRVTGVYSLPLCHYGTLMYLPNLCIWFTHKVIMM